jgi:hypothetical protein
MLGGHAANGSTATRTACNHARPIRFPQQLSLETSFAVPSRHRSENGKVDWDTRWRPVIQAANDRLAVACGARSCPPAIAAPRSRSSPWARLARGAALLAARFLYHFEGFFPRKSRICFQNVRQIGRLLSRRLPFRLFHPRCLFDEWRRAVNPEVSAAFVAAAFFYHNARHEATPPPSARGDWDLGKSFKGGHSKFPLSLATTVQIRRGRLYQNGRRRR